MKNTTKVLKFYSDPGHGWLAVKRQSLIDLGIADQITTYSYQRGATVYLEEDLDAGVYLKALRDTGVEVKFLEKNSAHKYSPIRSYDHYVKNFA